MVDPHSHTAGVGVGITLGATVLGWMVEAIPVLQAISLLVAIVAGTLTAVWYLKQIRANDVKADAIVAAADVRAKAIVVAEAVQATAAVVKDALGTTKT